MIGIILGIAVAIIGGLFWIDGRRYRRRLYYAQSIAVDNGSDDGIGYLDGGNCDDIIEETCCDRDDGSSYSSGGSDSSSSGERD